MYRTDLSCGHGDRLVRNHAAVRSHSGERGDSRWPLTDRKRSRRSEVDYALLMTPGREAAHERSLAREFRVSGRHEASRAMAVPERPACPALEEIPSLARLQTGIDGLSIDERPFATGAPERGWVRVWRGREGVGSSSQKRFQMKARKSVLRDVVRSQDRCRCQVNNPFRDHSTARTVPGLSCS